MLEKQFYFLFKIAYLLVCFNGLFVGFIGSFFKACIFLILSLMIVFVFNDGDCVSSSKLLGRLLRGLANDSASFR